MQLSNLQSSVLASAFIVSLFWCIKSFELLFNVDLSWLGLSAGNWLDGLSIFTAPLVHASLEHLFNNTLPLLLLLTALFYGYPRSQWRVIALVWVLSGLGVLLFARGANHLGASGLTHGIFFFLLVVSLIRRDKTAILLMMIAFFLYGGMTMTIFPREEYISFEYHFFGAVAGALAALLWHKRDPVPIEPKYAWEQDGDSEDPVIGDAWKLDLDDPNDKQQGQSQNRDSHLH